MSGTCPAYIHNVKSLTYIYMLVQSEICHHSDGGYSWVSSVQRVCVCVKLFYFFYSAGFLVSKKSDSSPASTTSPLLSLKATHKRALLKTRCRASESQRPAP